MRYNSKVTGNKILDIGPLQLHIRGKDIIFMRVVSVQIVLCGQANCMLKRKFFLYSQTMVLNYLNVKTICLFFLSNKFLDSHVKYRI